MWQLLSDHPIRFQVDGHGVFDCIWREGIQFYNYQPKSLLGRDSDLDETLAPTVLEFKPMKNAEPAFLESP